MKIKSKKKLSLDKIRIAKLQNPESIKGGAETEFTNPEVCDTTWNCNISTKTVAVGYTSACFTGI
ncbi:hypothetical protein [Aquimarina rubra]|uniref:Natural product n=1 Tax=Aquimarina rubra TaxID=1920033 RepID=A0ABW5LDF4_9FLAO